MPGSNSPVNPLFLPLLAALPMLYLQFFPLLDQFAGRMGDAKAHFNHSGHGGLNNDKCWKFPGTFVLLFTLHIWFSQGAVLSDAHTNTQLARHARMYASTRIQGLHFSPVAIHQPAWHSTPPLINVDKTSAPTYREYFLKYDLETNQTTTLNVVGFDDRDLVLHGIDLVQDDNNNDDTTKANKVVQLWAVNHDRRHESILKFTHVLGSNDLVLEREYTHPLIKTPNAVAASGPNSFFISNDHYVYPARELFGLPVGKYLRMVELLLGPFRWASGIVHCDASGGTTLECKQVSPPGQHPAANGVLLVDQGKTLLVNEVIKAMTTVYDVDPVTKMLAVRQEVDLGAAADNLSEISGTGDLAVCVFPSPTKLRARLTPQNLLNHSMHAEAAVVLLRRKSSAQQQQQQQPPIDKGQAIITTSTTPTTYADPEILYWDDGGLITILTGAAVDPVRRKMVAGGVVAEHFVVCDLAGARL